MFITAGKRTEIANVYRKMCMDNGAGMVNVGR